jgi:hypothetical protein
MEHMKKYKQINLPELTLTSDTDPTATNTTRTAVAYSPKWVRGSIQGFAEVVIGENPVAPDGKRVARLPDLVQADESYPSGYTVTTNQYKLVDFVAPTPVRVPKYLLLVELEELGFTNIEAQVAAAIASHLTGKDQSKADKGWRMQSDIRRDNSLLPLIQAVVVDGDSNPLTNELLDLAFVQAAQEEEDN